MFSLRKKEKSALTTTNNFQKELKLILGFSPKNIEYYKLALQHRSVAVVSLSGNAINNERLEFLGDAVLGMCIADYLYLKYPYTSEGELTKMRSKFVNGSNLEKLSKYLGISELIVSRANLRKSVHISGDAVEAFIGAIYLDRGFKKAQKFVEERFLKICENLEANAETYYNFKSAVIEFCQRNKREYSYDTIVHHNSSNHKPLFICNLIVDNEIHGVGFGRSKKDAEQNAARETLYSF